VAGVEDMIRMAERSLPISGRPNVITRWYAARNGNYFARAAWCDQSVTYWAHHSGNHAAVCFGKDYAYTVWHAQRFHKHGQWHVDIRGIRRGDIVFFDWGGSNRIGAIDHVGLVTGVKGGVVFTIEGNTSNRCRRRVRRASTIVGYGRPNYTGRPARTAAAAPPQARSIRDKAPAGSPFPGTLKLGSTGAGVEQVQRNLNRFFKEADRITVNGRFDAATQNALTKWQRNRLVPAASIGVVGPGTWAMLAAPGFAGTLKLGSKGKAVQQLKHALNKFPPTHLDTNNDAFDQATKQTVENWQRHRGQRVDGIVDMVTWYWIHAPKDIRPPNLHPR
jgi:peptidoglycan hydrolase-like protein with peptidoglycan-binding domain